MNVRRNEQMNGIALYGRYIRINFKAGLQYRGWPLQILNTLFTVITDPIGVLFLFSRFGSIGEWSAGRIMLIYALAVTSFGLAELFSRGYDYFPWKIRTGDFDRVLLRPRSLFVQIVGSYFHLHRFSRVAGGMLLIILCLAAEGATLSAWSILMLVFALLGGYFAYTGVFVITSGVAFFTISALDWIYIFTNVSYQVTRCPIPYMPRWMYGVFTFVMPMLVISYYPASAACGWGEPVWTGWLALPAGLLFLLISIFVWRFGVRHYKSTGS